MNIVCLDLKKYDSKYLYFFDSKPNHIIDGTFSKVMYTHESFTMNGIYVYVPMNINLVQKIDENKYNICINIEEDILNALRTLEIEILCSYASSKGLKKKSDSSLYKQLLQKRFRIYESFNKNIQDSYFILKISGVWENSTTYGITHKFLESKLI
jgi:hypothetical protein